MQNEPEYELIKSSRKTLAAEIKQGRLIIRAPHQAADDDIRRFIQKNRQWIETHLAKSRSREAAAESIPKLTPEELHNLAQQALKVIPARCVLCSAYRRYIRANNDSKPNLPLGKLQQQRQSEFQLPFNACPAGGFGQRCCS